jgi:hypothetical protein
MDIKSIVVKILIESINQELKSTIVDLFDAKINEISNLISNQDTQLKEYLMATFQELIVAQSATATSLITLNDTIVAETLEVKDLLQQIANGVVIPPADLQTAIDSADTITAGLTTSSDAIKAMVPTLVTPPTPTPVPTEPTVPVVTPPVPVPPGPPVEVPVVVTPTPVGTPETTNVKFR